MDEGSGPPSKPAVNLASIPLPPSAPPSSSSASPPPSSIPLPSQAPAKPTTQPSTQASAQPAGSTTTQLAGYQSVRKLKLPVSSSPTKTAPASQSAKPTVAAAPKPGPMPGQLQKPMVHKIVLQGPLQKPQPVSQPQLPQGTQKPISQSQPSQALQKPVSQPQLPQGTQKPVSQSQPSQALQKPVSQPQQGMSKPPVQQQKPNLVRTGTVASSFNTPPTEAGQNASAAKASEGLSALVSYSSSSPESSASEDTDIEDQEPMEVDKTVSDDLTSQSLKVGAESSIAGMKEVSDMPDSKQDRQQEEPDRYLASDPETDKQAPQPDIEEVAAATAIIVEDKKAVHGEAGTTAQCVVEPVSEVAVAASPQAASGVVDEQQPSEIKSGIPECSSSEPQQGEPATALTAAQIPLHPHMIDEANTQEAVTTSTAPPQTSPVHPPAPAAAAAPKDTELTKPQIMQNLSTNTVDEQPKSEPPVTDAQKPSTEDVEAGKLLEEVTIPQINISAEMEPQSVTEKPQEKIPPHESGHSEPSESNVTQPSATGAESQDGNGSPQVIKNTKPQPEPQNTSEKTDLVNPMEDTTPQCVSSIPPHSTTHTSPVFSEEVARETQAAPQPHSQPQPQLPTQADNTHSKGEVEADIMGLDSTTPQTVQPQLEEDEKPPQPSPQAAQVQDSTAESSGGGSQDTAAVIECEQMDVSDKTKEITAATVQGTVSSVSQEVDLANADDNTIVEATVELNKTDVARQRDTPEIPDIPQTCDKDLENVCEAQLDSAMSQPATCQPEDTAQATEAEDRVKTGHRKSPLADTPQPARKKSRQSSKEELEGEITKILLEGKAGPRPVAKNRKSREAEGVEDSTSKKRPSEDGPAKKAEKKVRSEEVLLPTRQSARTKAKESVKALVAKMGGGGGGTEDRDDYEEAMLVDQHHKSPKADKTTENKGHSPKLEKIGADEDEEMSKDEQGEEEDDEDDDENQREESEEAAGRGENSSDLKDKDDDGQDEESGGSSKRRKKKKRSYERPRGEGGKFRKEKQGAGFTNPAALVDEETRMDSLGQDEDSQGSAGKREVRRFRCEVIVPESTEAFTAEKVVEYVWPLEGMGEHYFIQEQISQYLGIMSFKRRYPDLRRRPIDMQERDYLKEKGLVSERACDLGLTAVRSEDVLDIMYNEFPSKFEELQRLVRERKEDEIRERGKVSYSLANIDKSKMEEYGRKAAADAARWNASFNKEKREERRYSFDLQTFTLQMPMGRGKRLPPEYTQLGFYPVAVLPGQYTDHYREYAAQVLKTLPLSSVLATAPTPGADPLEEEEDEEARSRANGSGGDLKEQIKPLEVGPRCKVCSGGKSKNKGGKPEPLIICGTCRSASHPTCIDLTLVMVPKIESYNWQCMDCKTCVTCNDPNDEEKMIFCDMCDRGYHIYCVGLRKVPNGRWHCKECAQCSSCGSKSPSGCENLKNAEWQHEFKKDKDNKQLRYATTLCVPCDKYWKRRQFCYVCLKVYRSIPEDGMVRCSNCPKYIHREGTCSTMYENERFCINCYRMRTSTALNHSRIIAAAKKKMASGY